MVLLEQIDRDKLPEHIAIIMDGNGRWAKEKGKMRVFGHKNGVVAVRDMVEGASMLGIKYLTLYTFSTENWSRPKFEVAALMDLMVSTMTNEVEKLMDNQIRLNAIGNLASLPPKVYQKLKDSIAKTSNNTGLTLTLALSYSARWEITDAVKQLAQKAVNGELDVSQITEQLVSQHLNTATMPDPELMIRTGGEFRVSNYLLWQLAYAELYFTPKLWPDFLKEDLFRAIIDYQRRERRFGLISEQLN
mgnify:CR=1